MGYVRLQLDLDPASCSWLTHAAQSHLSAVASGEEAYSQEDLTKLGDHQDAWYALLWVLAKSCALLSGLPCLLSTPLSWSHTLLCRELFVDGFGADGKRIYCKIEGKTCHQCRQKTLGHHTSCSHCESKAVRPYCMHA